MSLSPAFATTVELSFPRPFDKHEIIPCITSIFFILSLRLDLYCRDIIYPPSEPSLLALQAKVAAARIEARRARKEATDQSTVSQGIPESHDEIDPLISDKKIL